MPRSFEDALLSRIDREGRMGEYYVGEENFDKYIKGWEAIRPKFSDFSGMYPEDEIRRDQETVRRIETSPEFIRERTTSSVAAEHAIMEGVHNNGWFGEGGRITPTSSFDDKTRHVDAVFTVDTEDPHRPIQVGIDITTSEDAGVLGKKLNQTMYGLDQNRLTDLKYYIDDENPNIKGRLQVPRVIFGLSAEQANALQKGLSERQDFPLADDMRTEMAEEAVLQLKSSIVYLIRKHYRVSDRGISFDQSPEQVLSYLRDHQQAIRRQNPRLEENLDKCGRAMEYFLTLRSQGKEKGSAPKIVKGGTLLLVLRAGRIF